MSYKEKWINVGFDEGYLSALKDVLNYTIEFENNSADSLITNMRLRKRDFLKYWEENELDFIKEDELNKKALEIWLM
jgi:hypothetical protein